MNVELLRVWAGRQRADDLLGREIENLHRVVVACADQQRLAVLGQHDAARPLTDGDGMLDFERNAVDYGNRIVLLVRDIDRVGARIAGKANRAGGQDGNTPSPRHSCPPAVELTRSSI